jgi:hypothetical protein
MSHARNSYSVAVRRLRRRVARVESVVRANVLEARPDAFAPATEVAALKTAVRHLLAEVLSLSSKFTIAAQTNEALREALAAHVRLCGKEPE